MPHRQHTATVAFDRVQLTFQPRLLLSQLVIAYVAVETDHPPISNLDAVPSLMRGAGAEVIEKVRGRAVHIVMIPRHCISTGKKSTPGRGVAGLESGASRMRICRVSDHEDHGIVRNHLRRPRGGAF